MQTPIKLTLTLLLLLCLAPMPYGYYQLVRFLAFAGFGVLAYSAYKEKREWEVIVSIVLALLFQPFLKLSLGREIWNVIDVVVSIYLVITTFAFPRKVL